ncbi:MAG TPA: sigma factor [Propionibacteriaceae bacterium]|nr:sigma factor [Propionibacteriaceae bacterium]
MGQTRPALAESPRIAEVDVEAMTCPAADGLAERLHTGSKQAMAEVFSTHLDAIYNYCYRRSGSWSAAEDLTSSVFLEVWRSRQRAVELDGSLLPWLYGVATNVCRNHQRSQRRQARAR